MYRKLVILLCAALLTSCANLNLAQLGNVLRTAKQAFVPATAEEEQAIGREAAATLLGAGKIVTDEALEQYVNRVGRWVALQSSRPDLPWRFAVLDDPDINAFAAPGGYIFITKGLLLSLRNEAELAGVLGHEIVHVVEQHHLEAIQSGARLNLAGMALAEAASRHGHDPDTVRQIAAGAKLLYTRGLDKDDEFAADRGGVVLAARAGYDPYALLAVLLRLDAMNPDDAALALLFKTHPKPAERLDRLDAAMLGHLDRYASQPRGEQRFVGQIRAFVQ